MFQKKYLIYLIFVFICSLPIFLTFNRSVNYFDEGYMLEGARRIVSGEIPYRDFQFVYTPITIYILAFFLRIGGQFIIVERIASALISILGLIFLCLLSFKLSKNYLLTFLSMLFYSLWGPSHINFFWPVMVVIPFVFMYLYTFVEKQYILTGIVLGVILLSKHNFGASLLISLFAYLIFVRFPKQRIFKLCIGFAIVMTIFTAYLIASNSLISFFKEMYNYSIYEVFFHKSLSVPFPTKPFFKFIIYIFPVIISIMVATSILKNSKSKTLLFTPLTILTFYFFGILPTPDWTHLLPLLSITCILFVFIPRTFGNKYLFLSYCFMSIMICLGIFSLITRNYYRWEAPLTKHISCYSSGVMKYMCIDEKNRAIINQTLTSITKDSIDNQYIFAFYNNPIYYFLTYKSNPTKYIDFNILLQKNEEQKVINEIRKRKVNTIITRFSPSNSSSKLISYFITQNYIPIKNIYEFIVWNKK